eukprot:gene19682-14546_t
MKRTCRVTTTVLALLGCCIRACNTASSGHTTECNPHANVGCSQWTDNDRLKCSENAKEKGLMPWASRPERTPNYIIRELHGSDMYIPGTVTTIEVVVTKYEW